MKRQTPLILGLVGLSTFTSLPTLAQENRIENFFSGTPPYNSEEVNAPLNPVEEPQTSPYRDTQQFAPATPMTTDNQPENTSISPYQREADRNSSYEQRQTPITRDNFLRRNRE